MKPNITPGQELSTKHQPSRWEREWKRRRIIAIFVAIVIIAAGSLVGTAYYLYNIKPGHQVVVKVNDQVFDMNYFLKMFRVDNNVNPYASYYTSYASYYAETVVEMIQRKELVRQKAEELGIVMPTDEEIEAKLQSLFGFDPESADDDDDFNQQLNDFLKESNISKSDLENWTVVPSILQEKVQEVIGNDDDGANLDVPKDHVKVKAMLLGTEEIATEVKGKWSGDFDALVEEYSPSKYYPDEDLVEWIPAGIESSVFDGYIFDDTITIPSAVSDPIRDTNETTTGGYWLVMVYEPEEEEEHEEDGLYIKAILVDSNGGADDVESYLNEGNTFDDAASEYSLDTNSRDNGGDMGWLSLEDIDSQFGAGVLAVINGLSQDEISTPIETTDGYWLVMVTEGDGGGEEGELYINAILLATEDEADEVADEFDGSNFADLAVTYSLDSSASNGGDMGWMSQEDIESKFGTGVLAIINALSQDEVSTSIYDEDVSKQSGYWLIEVLDEAEQDLSEEHWEILSYEAYEEWLDEEFTKGEEEGWIISYLDDDKISWALDHL